MNSRHFEMRLKCTYADPDNSVKFLDVEHLVENKWQTLELDTRFPGFQIFVYAIFTCQHMYFRVNCAERGLILNSAQGSIVVEANTDWVLETLHVDFTGHLKSGQPNQGDMDYIVDRMKLCPVSRNLSTVPDSETKIRFET